MALTDASTSATALDTKLERLRGLLRKLERVAVAFSAGVDSTLLLKVAFDTLGAENVVAVTGRSASVPEAELDQARRLAASIGVEHVIVDTDEIENESYASNPTNRCYFCKTTLYAHMAVALVDRGPVTIVNGTNSDDLSDFRPGLEAASVHGVRSPLSDAGLTKRDVRDLSKRLGLETHDKPAGPCLSSRVAYGQRITPDKLRMIEQAEAFLRNELGVRVCRVRHHDNLARIEVPPAFIPALAAPATAARIDAKFRALGYAYTSLDLRGFRSGSHNEVVPLGTRLAAQSRPGSDGSPGAPTA